MVVTPAIEALFFQAGNIFMCANPYLSRHCEEHQADRKY
jgi:hypothetical protein